MNIEYKNYISVEDYIQLRDSVGFRKIPIRQATIGLQNTAYIDRGIFSIALEKGDWYRDSKYKELALLEGAKV